MKRDEFSQAVSGNGSCQVTRFLLFHKLLSRVSTTQAALAVLVSRCSIQGCPGWRRWQQLCSLELTCDCLLNQGTAEGCSAAVASSGLNWKA